MSYTDVSDLYGEGDLGEPEMICPKCGKEIYYDQNDYIDMANWGCCSDCAEELNNS